MKGQHRPRLRGLLIAVLACGAIAAAPQKQDGAASKLIQQIAKAAKGDVDAAAKLVAAAKTLQDSPRDQTAVCEKAYEYGTKTAEGLGSALEALDILDKADPARGDLWAERRIKVCRLLYYASSGKDEQRYGQLLVKALLKKGDAKSKPGSMKDAIGSYRQALSLAKRLGLAEAEQISARLDAAAKLLEVQGAMDPLKAKLKANPTDKAARTRLIEMCLVSLDSPAEAAKYLTADCDESLRKYVPLAAKPLEELKEAELLELGRWYAKLVEKAATPAGKGKAAARAMRYYRRFLSDHPAKDAMATAATLGLKTLKEQMEQLGLTLPDDPGETPWVDLLELIDLDRCAVKGKWARQDGALACSVSLYSLAAVPVTAAGGYDLHVVFSVARGHTSAVILPVGGAQAALVVGAGRGQYIGQGAVHRAGRRRRQGPQGQPDHRRHQGQTRNPGSRRQDDARRARADRRPQRTDHSADQRPRHHRVVGQAVFAGPAARVADPVGHVRPGSVRCGGGLADGQAAAARRARAEPQVGLEGRHVQAEQRPPASVQDILAAGELSDRRGQTVSGRLCVLHPVTAKSVRGRRPGQAGDDRPHLHREQAG